MRTRVIKADSIDEAADLILDELKENTNVTRSISSRNNVIYFDGFDGLGASAVLRAVARRLTAVAPDAPPGLQFDQVIYVDCSKWENMRALQREIAEQLALPAPTMEMFDRQDEEDDFDGVPWGSRSEMPQVLEAMYQQIQKLDRRFVIIFQNGSSKEINLESRFGFPLSRYSRNKVLWTFQGRFRLMPRTKVDEAVSTVAGAATDVFLSGSHNKRDPHDLWSYLVREEAADVASKDDAGGMDQHSQIVECFLYMWRLSCMGHQFRMDYDLATHGCNYWMCDGIVQLKQLGDAADGPSWSAACALQREMQLDVDYYQEQQTWPSNLVRCGETMSTMPYWTSPTYGVLLFPADGLFRHCHRLGVLKLSHCSFSFSSPPFLRCHGLRFLWLDHCEDQATSTDEEEDAEEEEIRRCFQRLWVLDVRYTSCDRILSAFMLDFMTYLRELNVMGAQDWDIGQLQGRLPNIRKLRVTKSAIKCSSGSEDKLFSGMNKMKLLDFSGNRVLGGMTSLFAVSNSTNNTLETIIIADGCAGSKNISFKGCTKLKSVILGGLFDELCSLDILGTAVKTLDLSAMTAYKLDELLLLDCDKLCAILWPTWKGYLSKLRMYTTLLASTVRTGEEKAHQGTRSAKSSVVLRGARAPFDLAWYISVRDSRILRSFCERLLRSSCIMHYVHMEISSAVDVRGSKNGSSVFEGGIAGSDQPSMQKQQPDETNDASVYADVAAVTIKDHLFQASESGYGDAQTITPIWPCPDAPYIGSSSDDGYVYLQDKVTTNKLPTDHEEYRTGTATTIPDFVSARVLILHVHDSLSITSIPGHGGWGTLALCRVERCPMLEFIFTFPQLGSRQGVRSPGILICYMLRTLWVSQLPKACLLWDTSKRQIEVDSFWHLEFLHLDFCPRLIHVLPFSKPSYGSRHNLETLEIVWCGDLRTIFPLHGDIESYQEQEQQQPRRATTVDFPYLKRIHRHELPKLQSICGSGRMYAPNLETIKIRGCWNLTRLPAIGRGGIGMEKAECDCEKDWWERLQWDGPQANHVPSLYKPTHPRYYKKKLLRGSVLM